MSLLATYKSIYNFFDLAEINLQLGEEIESVSTLTIPIYPDFRYAKKIKAMSDQLALYIGKAPEDIEILQGEGVLYLVINSDHKADLKLSELLERYREEARESSPLELVIGCDILNRIITLEIGDRNPHLLIAGSSGSGKSTLLTDIISQVLMRDAIQDIAFLIYSPKADLKFDGVIHDIDDIEIELERIYNILEKRSRGKADKHSILIILDECNSLISLSEASKGYIEKIAMRGRSERIHLILAMQSSKKANIQSPIILENIISRIIFRVYSKRESFILANTSEIDASKLLPYECYLLNHRGYARISIPLDDISSYAKEENVRLGGHSIESRNSQRLQFSKDRNIKERSIILAIPENLRYQLATRELKVISKSKLVELLNISNNNACELLNQLEDLRLLLPKKASNLPSEIKEERLTELIERYPDLLIPASSGI